MTSLADAFFGTIAYKNGLLTRDQLIEVVDEQDAEFQIHGAARTIGEICVEREYLTPQQVEDVLLAQEKSRILLEDTLYGKIAVRNDLVVDHQIEEALEIQRQDGYQRRIGQILVDRGYLSEQQVRAILRTQERLK